MRWPSRDAVRTTWPSSRQARPPLTGTSSIIVLAEISEAISPASFSGAACASVASSGIEGGRGISALAVCVPCGDAAAAAESRGGGGVVGKGGGAGNIGAGRLRALWRRGGRRRIARRRAAAGNEEKRRKS